MQSKLNRYWYNLQNYKNKRHFGECLLISVGYTKIDGSDVIHGTVENGKDANEMILFLSETKADDKTITCFFMETEIQEGSIDRYAFIDN